MSIFIEGQSQLGFYIFIKGSLLAKISKMTVPTRMDIYFKNMVLEEYNLNDEDDNIIWCNDEIDKLKYNKRESLALKFLSEEKMLDFSPYSSIFQQRYQDRINASKRKSFLTNDKVDLFIYNLEGEDILFFGGVNIFNEYMRELAQIHLTSSFTLNQKNTKDNKVSNIILYIPEDKIKELFRKIYVLNKERLKFMLNKISPLCSLSVESLRFFIYTVKIIFLSFNEKIELFNDKNIIYLLYKGSCCESKNQIIYSEGSFINLNNIMEKNPDNKYTPTTIYSKGTNTIIFMLDLNYLSPKNLEKLVKFLEKMRINQILMRNFYKNNVLKFEQIKKKNLSEIITDDKLNSNENSSLTNKIFIEEIRGPKRRKLMTKTYINKKIEIYKNINNISLISPDRVMKIKSNNVSINNDKDNKSSKNSSQSLNLPYLRTDRPPHCINQNPINNYSKFCNNSTCKNENKKKINFTQLTKHIKKNYNSIPKCFMRKNKKQIIKTHNNSNMVMTNIHPIIMKNSKTTNLYLNFLK